jgi:hypothetical protein
MTREEMTKEDQRRQGMLDRLATLQKDPWDIDPTGTPQPARVSLERIRMLQRALKNSGQPPLKWLPKE